MKKGMIKVSVFYPNIVGKAFDMDYYFTKHLPLVKQSLGSALKFVSAEKGLAGAAPDSPATYVVMGHLYFDSMESFQNSFGPHVEKLMADIKNFTSVEPVAQISEVLM